MGKPRKLGMKTAYIPNSKADMRYKKTIYQRGREFTERHEQMVHERRERRELAELERMKREAQT